MKSTSPTPPPTSSAASPVATPPAKRRRTQPANVNTLLPSTNTKIVEIIDLDGDDSDDHLSEPQRNRLPDNNSIPEIVLVDDDDHDCVVIDLENETADGTENENGIGNSNSNSNENCNDDGNRDGNGNGNINGNGSANSSAQFANPLPLPSLHPRVQSNPSVHLAPAALSALPMERSQTPAVQRSPPPQVQASPQPSPPPQPQVQASPQPQVQASPQPPPQPFSQPQLRLPLPPPQPLVRQAVQAPRGIPAFPPLTPDFLTTPATSSTLPSTSKSRPPITENPANSVLRMPALPPRLPTFDSNGITQPQQATPALLPNPNAVHVTDEGNLFRVNSGTIEIIDSDDEPQQVQPELAVPNLLPVPPITARPIAPAFIAALGDPATTDIFAAPPSFPITPPPAASLQTAATAAAPATTTAAATMSANVQWRQRLQPTIEPRSTISTLLPRAVPQQPPPYVPPPTVPALTHIPPPADADAKGGLTEEGFRTLVKQNDLTAEAETEAATPREMTLELMPHQKRALEWMTKRERPMDLDEEIVATDEECLGGILADEQGLGKTLTMVAVMLKNKPRQPSLMNDPEMDQSDSSVGSSYDSEEYSFRRNRKLPWKTLVVCPLSLLHQWRQEILSNIREENKPAVLVYHGPKRDREAANLKRYDVVITTYSTLQNEYPKVLKDQENRLRKEANLSLKRRPQGPLFKLHWLRVVLDEAHNVKNRNTENYAAVTSLRADVRWCLTGTPITNSVDDIYSLFCFVRYKFVPNHDMWKQRWKKKLEHHLDAVRRPAFKRFQTICGVVVLRRTKKDTINGKPLLNLPEKRIKLIDSKFLDKDEEMVYQAVQEKSVLEVNKFLMGGTAGLKFSSMLVLLLRLRQACCHPFLVQYSRTQGKGNGEMDERYATPYSQEELEEALEIVEGRESMLDMFEDSVRERLERGLRPPVKKKEIRWGPFKCVGCGREQEWKAGSFFGCGDMFCVSCCGVARRQGRCVRCDSSVRSTDGSDFELNANEVRMEVHAKVILGAGELDGMGVTGRAIKGWVREELERRKQQRLFSDDRDEDEDMEIEAVESNTGGSDGGRNWTEDISAARNEGEDDSRLLKERKREFLKAFSQRSTRISLIVDELNRVRAENALTKTLIFSQWVTLLDMLEFHVEGNGHETCRLDGSMTIGEREKQIDEFKHSEEKTVLLISLHAGGTGLNLTVANRVILADVWWNPCVEEQAIDRVHRIGQAKDVHVTRFKITGSVEERLYAICASKREKVAGALGESSARSLGRRKLTMPELLALFSGAAEDVVSRALPGSDAAVAARNVAQFVSQRQPNLV